MLGLYLKPNNGSPLFPGEQEFLKISVPSKLSVIRPLFTSPGWSLDISLSLLQFHNHLTSLELPTCRFMFLLPRTLLPPCPTFSLNPLETYSANTSFLVVLRLDWMFQSQPLLTPISDHFSGTYNCLSAWYFSARVREPWHRDHFLVVTPSSGLAHSKPLRSICQITNEWMKT